MKVTNNLSAFYLLLQDPNEDEETRQYRLKIEEQKRLREEILRRKEMRRQMQAGVRKKELLERLNSKTNTQSQGTAQTQAQPNQQMQHPVQQQQQQPLLQADQKRPLQQRQFPQQMQQTSNQTPRTLNQDNSIPPNSGVQIPASRPNVKERLQLGKSTTQQNPVPGSEPQWKQHQQNQQQALHPQRRNSILQGVNRPNAEPPSMQTSQNIPVTPSLNQGPAQTQGPKPGAKRTVMQRARTTSTEGQQVPQKVRVVKLSGLVSTWFLFLSDTFFFVRLWHLFDHLWADFIHKGCYTALKRNASDCPNCLLCNLDDV